MSRTIDERVVSMQFDNAQFEKNAQTSLGTIARLKQSLNFSGASKGIENVNAVAKSFTLSPMGNAVETVRMKFSALEVMAVTALSNITNSAVNAGKRITSSLTIEPIRTGFQEYETQIGAVQTILANTKSKGSTLDDVNAALDELNTYADKTIYNFTEMTRNIGTFTAAGVELDKSVQSIKGIANLAAISGSTSQQASTAMYQLSQALAAGTVKLMDWNSVVNAGMGGEVFQTALKRTAKQMGYNVDAMIEKYGSFRESLTQGEWLTAEVLTETLAQLSGAYTKADLISQGYTEKQAKEILELAATAESAATDVKTFTQLMDTLKESAQSGWTSTWELLVGDFEEAKQLWSSVYKVFGGMIEASANARNKLLAGALESNWDRLTKKINEAGVQTTTFENKIKEVAKSHNIDVDKIIEEHGSLKKAFQEGAISTDVLKEALNELGGSIADLEGVRKNLKMGDTGDDVKKVQEALKGLGYDLDEFGADGIIGKETTAAIKAFQEASGLKVTGIIDDETLKALGEGNDKLVKLKSSMGGLIDEVDKLGGRDLLIESFKNVFEGLMSVIKPISKAFREVFPPMTSERLYNLIEGFKEFTDKLKLTEPQMRRVYTAFKGIFEIFGLAWTFIKKLAGGLWSLLGNFSGLGDVVISFTGKVGDLLSNFAEMIRSGDKIGVVVKAITGFIQSAIDKFRKFGTSIRTAIDEAGGFTKAFGLDGLFGFFSGGWKKLKDFIDTLKSMDSISFADVVKLLTDFKNNVVSYFLNIDNPFEAIANWGKSFGDRIGKVFNGVGEKFDWITTKISNFVTIVKEKIGDKLGSIIAIGILIGFLLLVKKLADAISKVGEVISGFAGIFGNFAKNVTEKIVDFFESLNGIIKAKALEAKSEAMLNIAKAIALLAGSVWLLASIPTEDLKWAVGSVIALSLVMLGLSFALSKFEPGDFGKMSLSLLGLSGALILFALAAKSLEGVGWDALKKTGVVIVGFLTTLAIASAILNRSHRDLSGFGTMMTKLSIALLLFGVAARILGGMDSGTLIQGGIAVATFLGLMAVMMGYTKTMAKNVPKFGSMMIGLSAALLLMSASVAIFGTMKVSTLVQGGIVVTLFLGIMAAMMAATKSMAKHIPRFGSMMLGMSAALLLMAASIVILGNMDAETVMRGGVAVVAFIGIMALLMKATELMGSNSASAAKIGLMMLSFAGGVLALTAAIALLGLMDQEKLNKAVGAIAKLAAIFGALMIASKFSGDFKGIITLAAAVGILAVSIAALSFIDSGRLQAATMALSAIVGMFALLTAATKFVNNKAMIGVATMALIIGGLALVLSHLAKSSGDDDKALKVAASLSLLIASLSVSAGMLAAAGKFGRSAFVGVGVLAAVLGVLSIFAAIAIWQLPNVAKQLSSFMDELQPFLTGIKSIDTSALNGIKTLADAIFTFTDAAGKHALMNVFTFGGMSRAFTSFAEFIKEVVPVVKDLAIDISAENVTIDVDDLNAVINAVVGLAEAANNVPANTIAGAITKFGAVAYIKSTDLRGFTEWVTEIVPVIKDLALSVSSTGVNINIAHLNAIIGAVSSLAEAADKAPTTDVALAFSKFGGGMYLSAPDLKGFATFVSSASDAMKGFASGIADIDLSSNDVSNITSICEAVGLLADAADAAPGIDVAVAFAKFGKGVGGGTYISIPNLIAFKEWLDGVMPIMSGFAVDVKECELTEADANALSTICKSIEYLGVAAGNAPTMDIAAAFSKFPGGFGLGGYISIPNLTAFKEWIEQVVPVMSGFALDIKESELTEADATALSTICKSVEYLGTAAGNAPGIDVAAGFANVGPAIAAGAYVSIPNLTAFKEWIEQVVPVMSGFAIDIQDSEITESDATALSTICKAIEYLGIAASNAPGVEVAAGFASVGPLIAAGAYVSIPNLTAFKEWIEQVVPVMSGFAIDVKETNITADNASTLAAICQAVGYLGEAAKNAPTEEEAAALTLIGAATYVKSTDLQSFTDWIESVVPVISGFAVDIKEIGVTDETATTLTGICKAVTILADAAALVPKEETYSNVFGKWVSTSDLSEFATWIEDIVEVLQKVSAKLAENEVALDTAKLAALASSGKVLAETISIIATTYWSYGSFNVDDYYNQIDKIADAMVNYSSKVSNIDDASVKASASAAKNIALTLNALSGFDYSSVSISSFSAKLDEIATAMTSFSEDLKGVDVSPAVSEVKSLTSMLSGMATIDFSGSSSFETALGDISKTGIEKFIKAFTDSEKDVISAAKTLVSNCAESIRTSAMYNSFYNAGKYLVEGLASGISANTYKAEAKSKAMAEAAVEAAREALKINSPAKVMIPLGEGIDEGLIVGIDNLIGNVKNSAADMARSAIDGTKNAIARIADVINSDIDAQPTIRPVLDLSAVSAGAGAINGMFNMSPSVGVMSNLNSISSMMNGRQNGGNDDVISAIKDLGRTIGDMHGDTYSINGITYDDGSNISDAVKSLVRAARVERRI